MNKAIIMGRLTKDPEARYTQDGKCVCRYTLAVNRSFKREGEPEADFLNIVAFNKSGEFATKYFKKGMMVAVVGEIRISSYTDKDGNNRKAFDVIAGEQHFCESKKDQEKPEVKPEPKEEEFFPIEGGDDLPF